MEKIKKETEVKGITLIALVITIIVLLILAAISITMLTGDNSILKRSVDAKERTELSSLKEEAQIVMLNRVTEKTTLGSNTKTLKEDLESGISNAIVESINTTEESEGLTDVYYVCKNGQYVTVYEDGDIEDGKVEIWDGEKVSCPEFKKENNVWNWYIYTPSQLKFLADFVNNGNSLTGTVNLTSYVTDAGYNVNDISIMAASTIVYLMNDLDLGAREVQESTLEKKWETNANKKVKWTPIGIDLAITSTAKVFFGIFEGNNHIIRNAYVDETNSENGCAGIFSGYCYRIRNLTVKNSYIKGKDVVGGIATCSINEIINCKSIDSTVISKNGVAGGIAGGSWWNITNCTNNSMIIGNKAGGIVGELSTKNMTIRGCENKGIVIVQGSDSYVGGIIGLIYKISPVILDCINEGRINGAEKTIATGGILGGTYQDSSVTTIIECKNNGEILGMSNYIGGILGLANKISIKNCNNTGNVNAPGYNSIGGIAGYVGDSSTIIECTNRGTITGNLKVDGIVGESSTTATITNCKNDGKINIVDK